MFKFIEGLPTDVMAIEAIGEVTDEDYRSTLITQGRSDDSQGSPHQDALCHREGFHRV